MRHYHFLFYGLLIDWSNPAGILQDHFRTLSLVGKLTISWCVLILQPYYQHIIIMRSVTLIRYINVHFVNDCTIFAFIILNLAWLGHSNKLMEQEHNCMESKRLNNIKLTLCLNRVKLMEVSNSDVYQNNAIIILAESKSSTKLWSWSCRTNFLNKREGMQNFMHRGSFNNYIS